MIGGFEESDHVTLDYHRSEKDSATANHQQAESQLDNKFATDIRSYALLLLELVAAWNKHHGEIYWNIFILCNKCNILNQLTHLSNLKLLVNQTLIVCDQERGGHAPKWPETAKVIKINSIIWFFYNILMRLIVRDN